MRESGIGADERQVSTDPLRPDEPPPGPVHEAPLDGVRALAAGLVVLTHAAFLTGFTANGDFLGRLAGRGDFGVHLFFALSAYLLTSQFLLAEAQGRTVSLTRYAVRRLGRVLPAYWITLAVVVAVARPEPRAAVLNAGALQIYVSDATISEFSQSWSVATELSFYAVLPLLALAMVLLRRRWRWAPMVALLVLAVTALVALAWSPTVTLGEDVLPERLLTGVAPVFLAGMVLAEAKVNGGRVAARLARWAREPVACVAVAAATYVLATTPLTGSLLLSPTHGVELMLRILLGTVVATGVLLPLVLGGPNVVRDLLGGPVIRWVGVISYGIFLWHLPVFIALVALSGRPAFSGGFVPLLAIGVPVTVGLAALSYYVVELPVMRLTARWGRR